MRRQDMSNRCQMPSPALAANPLDNLSTSRHSPTPAQLPALQLGQAGRAPDKSRSASCSIDNYRDLESHVGRAADDLHPFDR